VLDRQRYIGTKDGDSSGGTTANHNHLERFLKEFEQFPREMLLFAKQSCETSSILEHPIYCQTFGLPSGKGRVTLMGDAAHIMTPNMGMGTPSAIKDAVSLSHALARHGLTRHALRAYETKRQPRVNRIAEAAIRQTNQYYHFKYNATNPFKMNSYPDLLNFI
jgi:2-polyprenyl-6-methoxyphenol hydroxylase-like FAD-dependent oxidoreductase